MNLLLIQLLLLLKAIQNLQFFMTEKQLSIGNCKKIQNVLNVGAGVEVENKIRD